MMSGLWALVAASLTILDIRRPCVRRVWGWGAMRRYKLMDYMEMDLQVEIQMQI